MNSARAIQFRQWATGVLRDYAIRGYVLDKERLKNGAFLSKLLQRATFKRANLVGLLGLEPRTKGL